MRRKIGSVVVLCHLVGLLAVPAMAEMYTNADLDKLHLPGAYTNKDLKTLEPLPAQEAPLIETPEVDLSRWLEAAAVREAGYRALVHLRDRLQAELDYELGRLALAYSPAGGNFTGSLRPGLRSKLQPKLDSLQRRIYLTDWELDQQ